MVEASDSVKRKCHRDDIMVTKAKKDKGAAPVKVDPPSRVKLHVYVPNEKDRTIVTFGAALGYTQDRIARLVDLSEATIKRHYPEELATGADKVTMQIANNLAKIAMGNDPRTATRAAEVWFSRVRPIKRDAEVEVESLGPVRVTLRIGEAPLEV